MTLDDLRQALHSLQQPTVIAFTASKGGVGKTVTTANVAAALARIHAATDVPGRVLVVDADSQCGTIDALRDPDVPTDPDRTLGAVLADTTRRVRVRETIRKSRWDPERIHFVDSNYLTLEEAADRLPLVPNWRMRMRELLAGVQGQYKWILIDTTPRPRDPLAQIAWIAADYLVVPTSMYHLGMDGIPRLDAILSALHRTLGKPRPVILGYLVTMMRAGVPTLVETERSFRELLGPLVLRTAIPLNNDLAQAFSARQSVFDFNSRASGAIAYGAVTEEIISRVAANQ